MQTKQTLIFRQYDLEIVAADRPRFVAEGTHNMTTSLANEAGTLSMYATHADAAGTQNVIFELYQDEASYQVHADSPQFKQYGQLAQAVVTNKSLQTLRLVDFVSAPSGFNVSGPNANQLLKLDVSVVPALEKPFLTKVGQQLRPLAAGQLAGYVARLTDQPTHWVILLTYTGQRALTKGKQRWLSTLKPAAERVTAQVLTVDTMVAQPNLLV